MSSLGPRRIVGPAINRVVDAPIFLRTIGGVGSLNDHHENPYSRGVAPDRRALAAHRSPHGSWQPWAPCMRDI